MQSGEHRSSASLLSKTSFLHSSYFGFNCMFSMVRTPPKGKALCWQRGEHCKPLLGATERTANFAGYEAVPWRGCCCPRMLSEIRADTVAWKSSCPSRFPLPAGTAPGGHSRPRQSRPMEGDFLAPAQRSSEAARSAVGAELAGAWGPPPKMILLLGVAGGQLPQGWRGRCHVPSLLCPGGTRVGDNAQSQGKCPPMATCLCPTAVPAQPSSSLSPCHPLGTGWTQCF